MRPWDDIDDLTDIYINQVVYPDEDAEQDDRHVVPRTDFVEMPRSIFVTQVCSLVDFLGWKVENFRQDNFAPNKCPTSQMYLITELIVSENIIEG